MCLVYVSKSMCFLCVFVCASVYDGGLQLREMTNCAQMNNKKTWNKRQRQMIEEDRMNGQTIQTGSA